MAIEKELLDQLLAGRDDLKKALSERILNAELDEHLDGERVEGGSDRHVEDDAIDPARPDRDVRSEADREVSAACLLPQRDR
jgi:hypothetical protein